MLECAQSHHLDVILVNTHFRRSYSINLLNYYYALVEVARWYSSNRFSTTIWKQRPICSTIVTVRTTVGAITVRNPPGKIVLEVVIGFRKSDCQTPITTNTSRSYVNDTTLFILMLAFASHIIQSFRPITLNNCKL